MNLRILTLSLLLTPVLGAAATGWKTYSDPNGTYSLNYPPTWNVMTKGNALVISSPGGVGDRGVFGITPRPSGTTIEDSVEREFNHKGRPQDLQKVPSKIAGYSAMKVWGSKIGDPNTRVVEYYVQVGDHTYYILFQSPQATAASFSSLFNGMIGSIKFTQ